MYSVIITKESLDNSTPIEIATKWHWSDNG